MLLNINIEEPVSKFTNNPEKEILLYWYIKEVLLKRFPTSSNILQNNIFPEQLLLETNIATYFGSTNPTQVLFSDRQKQSIFVDCKIENWISVRK